MAWTKREFCIAALGEIGLADYVYDLPPEALQRVLSRLDAMMATLNGQGVRLGYPLPSSQSASDLDQETNVPDSANEMVFQNLACRIAGGFGKTVSPDTKISAFNAWNAAVGKAIGVPPEMQLPGSMPAGAGNKPWRTYDGPFIAPPSDPVDAGDDGPINFY